MLQKQFSFIHERGISLMQLQLVDIFRYSILIISILCSVSGSAQIDGQIIDDHGHPLPRATVLLLPDSIYGSTNDKGQFRFNVPPGDYQLEITYVGYLRQELDINAPASPTIEMKEESTLLSEAVVTARHDHLESALDAQQIDRSDLEEADRSSFARSLERVPGINALQTGVGIAKPIIRGLTNNRVLVSTYGVTQQGQQWGYDHGLEIDAFSVDRVEIIKGPASLVHGSDGLGGIIRILPSPIPDDGSWEFDFEGLYKSNNNHIGSSARLATRQKDWFFIGRFSRQDFADYQVPAESFVFQGFELPIFNGFLKNTAGQEQSFGLSFGRVHESSSFRLSVESYDLAVGLFAGAIGIPRAYSLDPDGNARDVDFPSQDVSHLKGILNYQLELNESQFVLDAAWQRNRRAEFSFPEFHSAGNVDPNDRLALQFLLNTVTVNSHLDRESGDWDMTYGIGLEVQDNVSTGFELLIPDFNTFRGGAYFTAATKRGINRINFGLRLDYAQNQTQARTRFVYNSDGGITDSLAVPEVDTSFFNYSASLGLTRPLTDWLALRVHLGKSFRVPHPAEMVSNGVHHGTFRHEFGTPDLLSEHGYQADLGLESDPLRGNWRFAISSYFNFFDNYIYLSPSGNLSPLPEAGQIFQYIQNDVIFTGFEAEIKWALQDWLEWSASAEYVYNYNLGTELALPFTPPASIRTDVRLQLAEKKWGGINLLISPHYHFAQNRVDRNERTTPDYFLLDFVVSSKLHFGKQDVFLGVKGFNVLNTFYFNHLSRYRLIDVPEQGRNIVVSLRLPLQWSE